MSDTSSFLSRVENKDVPQSPPPTKIVEAFGLGKCPKLVNQIASRDLSVRNNALIVLCDEFQNPYSVDGCVRAGVIPILADMIGDPDFTSRIRSSFALSLAAKDANGLASILAYHEYVFPRLLRGVEDSSEEVRGNIYQCLLLTTRTSEGVSINVLYGTTHAFVEAARKDVLQLKPPVLKALHNLVSDPDGLTQSLERDAVSVFISLLSFSETPTAIEREVVSEAARTLGYMCYDGRAKIPALEGGAIGRLIGLLKLKDLPTSLKISLTLALMAITITSDGKKQVYEVEGLDILMRSLYDDSRAVVLNTLKIISNLAVYPRNRDTFLNDSTCVVKIRKLSKSEDALVAKHATAALEAVNWNP